MKSFVLSELSLLSLRERKARKVNFHPQTTVILGGNRTGKSSLLKSIYAAFGADPAKTHSRWQNAEVITSAKFSVDGAHYTILRDRSFFAVFDGKDEVIGTFSRVTSELGPFLANLFDFRLTLPDRKGQPTTPPPAYLFLPFYVDQDAGWQSSWSSFANLHQFPRWKIPVAEYHSGIRPNEYYALRASIDGKRSQLDEREREVRALQSAHRKVREHLTKDTFTVDLDVFQAEINRLITECNRIRALEEEYKSQLFDLRSTQAIIAAQIGVAQRTAEELAADNHYASVVRRGQHIDCPTCGATYENSFAERFRIAQDEDRCRDLLIQLKEDQRSVETQIAKLTAQFTSNRLAFDQAENLLAERRGAVRLQDVIESHGRYQVESIFEASITDYFDEMGRREREIADLRDALKEYDDKKRKRRILGHYRSLMRRFLLELDVRTLTEKSYTNITSSIDETGSNLPRALLAYYFSVLNTMVEFSSNGLFPIVIDSPNQQAQDRPNLTAMLQFIRSHQPPDSQLILGAEDTLGVRYDGMTIELSEKLHLLQAAEFHQVRDSVVPMLESAYSFQ